ncbi:MAG: hypothetical protein Q4B18_04680, partial [Bacillota bacterium]|nr:hypothetical protein [Bacillota bacterium]
MKTIEIMIGGQKAQFTTKSVALDGKEYSYAKMSQVHHDAENHLYSFVYEGEAKEFHYEEKSAKVLAAIFSQVQKMDEMRKAKAEEKVPAAPVAEVPAEETPAEVPTEAPTVEPEAPAKPEPAVEPEAQEETKASENAATYDEMDEMIKATIAINEVRAKKEEEKAKKK